MDIKERILEHFNIELNNPMTILQQEEAKNFFKENDDKKMYQFFQRGSMLESIDVTNKKTMHQIGLMHESLQVKNFTLDLSLFLHCLLLTIL